MTRIGSSGFFLARYHAREFYDVLFISYDFLVHQSPLKDQRRHMDFLQRQRLRAFVSPRFCSHALFEFFQCDASGDPLKSSTRVARRAPPSFLFFILVPGVHSLTRAEQRAVHALRERRAGPTSASSLKADCGLRSLLDVSPNTPRTSKSTRTPLIT